MKLRNRLILMAGIAVLFGAAVLLAQQGIGGLQGKKLYDHSNDVIVLPSYSVPLTAYGVPTSIDKQGMITTNGTTVQVFLAGRWATVTVVTPTPTPSATASPTAGP
jgi:hypothetical protein